ncbi:MAG: TIGR00153 family protein [Desulfobacteraceae bacterium IS3]|nr:MAG: TIGR00153 family protein [Desulfobacteraceae bacterium IS3]
MFLKKIFSQDNKEQKVIEGIRRHIKLLCTVCDTFKTAFENHDLKLMREVFDIEREGDSIRREIISDIYQGAFLPYIRPDLCVFVELVDRVFDLIEDTAFRYLDVEIPEEIKGECCRVAFLNTRISEMLLITFEAMLKGDDLREKTLAVRIYEKKIDDIKFVLIKNVHKIPISDFWQGRSLAEFISGLTSISDIIEDASDHLQIINVSMR